MNVTLKEVLEAHERIKPHIHCTPVLTSTYVSSLLGSGRQLYFKSEHLQVTGSFKTRGALNAILCAKQRFEEDNQTLVGVVTHSSGNHGQAVAWAARKVGVKCVVVVPQVTPQVKVAAIQQYGADVRFCGNEPSDRVEMCAKVSAEEHLTIIPPYDHLDIIAGQGTTGVEFLSQTPQLDAVLVSVSGGGLSAGTALALKSLKPNIRVYLVEPLGKELQVCLEQGKRLWTNPPKNVDTIAEGIRLQQVGVVTFPYLVALCEKQVLSVTNEDMIEGMKIMACRTKQIVEAAASAAVMAAVKHRAVFPENVKHIGVILCGGNLDIDQLPW